METAMMTGKNSPPPNGQRVPQKGDEPPHKEGTERDIMQLVAEVMRDSLCVHVIIDGLRGKDRSLIEQVLVNLPEVPKKAGTERDIMQFVADSFEKPPELPAEVLKALNHLLGNGSSYLSLLVRLARGKKDWRTLPAPVKP